MHHFSYRAGRLHAEDVALDALAREVGTPFYCYARATLERHFRVFAKTLGAKITGEDPGRGRRVFFAMKANSNLSVIRTLGRLGAGVDTVSEGEIRKALAAGIAPGDIVFSGVGKTQAELTFAVVNQIYQINVETEHELDMLSAVGRRLQRTPAAVLRINPDVGSGGHAKITTGSAANKFGVSLSEAHRLYAKAQSLPGVRVLGLAVHIGSQILALDDLEAAFSRMRDLVVTLRAQGHTVERLDLGGGLGIPYHLTPDQTNGIEHGPGLIEAYAQMIDRVLGDLDVELGFEPGRLIVGNAGILVSRVLALNPRPEKTFVVVDAAMNDLIRPAMYEAYHEIWPVQQAAPDTFLQAYDVVGPVCESGDTFATGRKLPPLAPGDLVAFMTAGAYGAVMASTYNTRLLVPEVLVSGADHAVVRPRLTYEALIGQDRLPPWLKTKA